VSDNIAAIAAHIEALRAQERYGVGTIEQAFAGYSALEHRTWQIVLRLDAGASLDRGRGGLSRPG